MTFDEALAAASEGDFAKAMQFFAADEQPLSSLMLTYEDDVTFHDEGGMPTTSLPRDFVLSYRGAALSLGEKNMKAITGPVTPAGGLMK